MDSLTSINPESALNPFQLSEQDKATLDQAWKTTLDFVGSIRDGHSLRNFSRELDFLDEELRAKIWKRFTELVLGPIQAKEVEIKPQYQFFSPMVQEITRPRREMYTSALQLITVIQEFKESIAASLFARKIFSVEQTSELTPADQEFTPTEAPECCAEDVLLPEENSPFGTDFVATLAQLRCLKEWANDLDQLAPAVKTAIWRVCQSQGADFGYDHDITSFAGTVERFNQPIDTHVKSIAILFSALG